MQLRSNISVLIGLFLISLLAYIYLRFNHELTTLRSENSRLELEFLQIKQNVKKKNKVDNYENSDVKRRFVENITSWDAKKPALYHGHLAYIDFNRFGVSNLPIYINIIRKPLDRMISYYYFLRYGDDYRPHLKRRRKGNTETFDECVKKRGKDCDPVGMWMQIPFFCGHNAECWEPGSRWALEQAKHNLAHNYLVVGVMEEMQDFIAVLEYTLPEYFNGALKRYMSGGKSHLRKTSNKIEPSTQTINKIQSTDIWKLENEFYEFTLNHFQALRSQMLKVENGYLVDKGQMFRYEKIRPK
ncbi:Heparan sulfate 2-O-sulfotransferase 1 [Nymphon striatum]|nr:Heparan sulfate 2-O-sulfotransferase 1 [Nymphon striatum]